MVGSASISSCQPSQLAQGAWFYESRVRYSKGCFKNTELRSSAWRQLFHNVYADSRADFFAPYALPGRGSQADSGRLCDRRPLSRGPATVRRESPRSDEPVEVLVEPGHPAVRSPARTTDPRGALAGRPRPTPRCGRGCPLTNSSPRTCWDLESPPGWGRRGAVAVDRLTAPQRGAITVPELARLRRRPGKASAAGSG